MIIRNRLHISPALKLTKNDITLAELYEQGEWKQALTHCEKRQKRGEKGDFFLFLKAIVQIEILGPSQKQGQKELIALLEREPPIIDAGLLRTIEGTIVSIDFQDALAIRIWDRALAHQPRNEDLLRGCFDWKFEKKEYQMAHKAAMLYQRNFSHKRQPYYWFIVSGYLASVSATASPIDRKTYGQIACRLLAKAAADAIAARFNVASKAGHSDSSRALKGPSDLLLLVLVYRSQDWHRLALDLLDNPCIGLSSDFCERSWDLARAKIELLERSEEPAQLWDFCYDLLQDAHPDNLNNPSRKPRYRFGSFGDDCLVWDQLVNIANASTAHHKKSLTVELIESYLTNGKRVQNAFHALVHYYSQVHILVQIGQTYFRAALDRYYQQYGSRPVCFSALQPYVHRLHPSQQLDFLEHCAAYASSIQQKISDHEQSRVSWINFEVNSLALDYNLIVSRVKEHSSTALIDTFIENCIRLHKLSLLVEPDLPPTDRRSGDDAAVMAATACIHLYHWNGGTKGFRSLARAALILEVLLTKSKHNYAALLLVVQLYLHIGCISMAIEHWRKLDIKNVQHATASWMLFSRISTISPGTISVPGGTFDPQEEVRAALMHLDADSTTLRRDINDYFIQENYVGIIELAELADNFALSTSRCIFLSEMTRLDRLCNTSLRVSQDTAMFRWNIERLETRDAKGLPDREAYGQSRIEECIGTGPKPQDNWIDLHHKLGTLHNVLIGIARTTDDLIWSSESDHEMPDLTPSEYDLAEIPYMLTRLLGDAGTRNPHNLNVANLAYIESWIDLRHKTLKSLLDDQNAGLMQITHEVKAPGWYYFHWNYIVLDALCLIRHTFYAVESMYVCSDKLLPTWYENKMKGIDQKRLTLSDGMQQMAQKIRTPLEQYGTVKDLVRAGMGCEEDVEDSVGQELRMSPTDRDLMEDVALRMLGNWRAGLDNVQGFFGSEMRS